MTTQAHCSYRLEKHIGVGDTRLIAIRTASFAYPFVSENRLAKQGLGLLEFLHNGVWRMNTDNGSRTDLPANVIVSGCSS